MKFETKMPRFLNGLQPVRVNYQENINEELSIHQLANVSKIDLKMSKKYF